MNDLISRQMLLEYIHGEPVGRLLCDKYNLDGLIEQLPSAQPEQRWIPCSTRLPFDAGYYLTTTTYNEVFCDYWNLNEWNRTEQVIAWMLLPEPYKGDDNEG